MLLLLTLTSLSMMSLTQAACSISPAKDNMVATRLEGNWTFSGPFSARLSPDGMTSNAPVGEMIVSFTNNSSVLEDIPEDNCAFLKTNQLEIYLAGTLEFLHFEVGMMSHTYILTSMDGVPALIYWQGVNAITNLLQVAPAILPMNDLIFLGEKSGYESFKALKRESGPSRVSAGMERGRKCCVSDSPRVGALGLMFVINRGQRR